MNENFETLIRAGYAALYVQTSEELRFSAEFGVIAKKLERPLWAWSITTGLVDSENGTKLTESADPLDMFDVVLASDKNPVVVLNDFHAFLDSPMIIRKMRDTIAHFRANGGTFVIISPVMKLPPELAREVTPVSINLPDGETLGKVLDGILEASKQKSPENGEREAILGAAAGLTTLEAENAFALSLVEKKKVDAQIVTRQKIETLKKGGILEYYPPTVKSEDVGGLSNLKAWLGKRKKAFSKKAREFGLPSPKGILLTGTPGTGKSLTAKATSAVFGLPLLRLDVGRVFGSLVGQSEQAIRDAINTAEAMAPCILWIDEIEKAFAGSRGGGLDSGVGVRVFGTFLTWMSEKKADVFVIATANDVTSLPAELLRKGRFDEIFNVDLPTFDERMQIAEIHLAKRKRKLSLKEIAQASDGYSGAEIEACVISALYDAFEQDRELTVNDVVGALQETTPLSRSMKEQVDKMRAWSKTYARSAGKVEAKSVSGRKVNI